MIRIGDSAILETGTTFFYQGQTYTNIIQLNNSDPEFEPVIVATPVSDITIAVPGSSLPNSAPANVNVHLDTELYFNNSTKKWQFLLHRSIGANADDPGAEPMTVLWKVIALRNVRRDGPTVTVAEEPH